MAFERSTKPFERLFMKHSINVHHPCMFSVNVGFAFHGHIFHLFLLSTPSFCFNGEGISTFWRVSKR